MSAEREPAGPSMLGAIYFGCAVLASAALSIVIGIGTALAR